MLIWPERHVPKMGNASTRLLTRSYSLVRRSGFLTTSLGSSLFSSAYFLYKRYLEDDLAGIVRSRPELFRDGSAVDVGANIGYTAALLASALDPGSHVYAFEPEPFNSRLLARTAGRCKDAGRIVPVQSAVGDEDGTVTLWLNEHHHADHRIVTRQFAPEEKFKTSITVPIVKLDTYLGNHPDPLSFIKIDVQGYEFPVCHGMSALLERNRSATVLLEFDPHAMQRLGFSPGELLQFLGDRKFSPYVVGKRGALTPGIPSDLKSGAYVDLLFSRRPL